MDRGFRHEALFYADDDELLAGTAPLVRGALAADQHVLALLREPSIRLLRAELADQAERVRFVEMEEVGRNPARLLPIWRDFVDAYVAGGRGAVGIGEPVWPHRSADELTECQHHESLLNTAFAAGPRWTLVCPYDTSALDDAVLEEAARSHPVVSSGGSSRGSVSYEASSDGRPFTGPLLDAPADAEAFVFGGEEVASLRRRVRGRAGAAGLSEQRSADLALAVTELVSNSIRHGGGGGALRLWVADGSVVCEVSDAGRFEDALVGRLRPSRRRVDGRGLWLVNQVCDLVQIRNAPEGNLVRLQMRVDAPG